jgi:hypothetical protein
MDMSVKKTDKERKAVKARKNVATKLEDADIEAYVDSIKTVQDMRPLLIELLEFMRGVSNSE